MSTQNLKFIHLANRATAQHSTENIGAIIFEPKSGRIAVNGTSGLEYYGGGRIADAKFDKDTKILEISFNNGDPAIKLDFSDTASAEGVNAIMKAHADRISALETTVNGTDKDGVHTAGLVDKVTKNTTDIAKNASDIADINNESNGILAQAKSDTDSKLNTLKGEYTGNLKGLDDAIKSNDADITALQDLHANKTGESGKMKVIDEINAKVGEIDTDTVKKYVDAKVETIDRTTTELTGRVETLETTVGNASSGLVKKVADLSALHASGSHNGYSTVAEEAAAEVAKVVANAPADFDTLKEIADWIANDKTDAAAMQTDIANLKTSVGAVGDAASSTGSVYARIAKNTEDIAANAGNISTNTTNITANANDIKALQGLHASGKSVAEEVAAGINGLGTDTKTNDEGDPKKADVVVSVTTTKGKVSAVAVDASVLDGKVTAEVTRATNAEKGLRDDLGTKLETEDDAFTRIKALEEAQSSGSLMWSVWDEVSPV